MKPMVVVLAGPTASGKTAVSLPLAEQLHAEILSADSRQIYRHLDIGTAKPTPSERTRVPHHFIDIRNPDEEYNAGLFGEEGREEIARILSRGRVPLVVGGSGLYIQSLVDGFFDGPPADLDFRAQAMERLRAEGVLPLLEDLAKVDPDSAASIDPTKPRRVVRALEVYHITGIPLSVLHRERKPEIPFVPLFFGLELDRAELYQRINTRCERMLEGGLLDEVESLVVAGYSASLNALKTVGYAEAFAYRRGEISYEDMVRLFKQNSRRYAKRQLTWFRHDPRIRWIPIAESDHAVRIAGTIAGLIPPRATSEIPPADR
jgi:tRNA dimethylallyltransferase